MRRVRRPISETPSILLLRRAAAFLLDYMLCGVVFYLGLAVDRKFTWLDGMPGQQLGITLMVFWFILAESVFSKTPGKATFRLRIAALDGSSGTWRQRAVRALLFWLLTVNIPFHTSVAGLMNWLLRDLESQTVFGAATTLWLMSIPAVSIVVGHGRRGFHDISCGLQVLSERRVPSTTSESINSFRVLRVPESGTLWSTLLLLWGLMATLSIIAAWKTEYISKWADDVGLLEPVLFDGSRSDVHRLHTFSGDGDVFHIVPGFLISGAALEYQIEVPQAIIEESVVRRRYAVGLVDTLRTRIPSSVRWVDLRLYTQRSFGYGTFIYASRYVFDLKTSTLTENPKVVPAEFSTFRNRVGEYRRVDFVDNPRVYFSIGTHWVPNWAFPEMDEQGPGNIDAGWSESASEGTNVRRLYRTDELPFELPH